MTEFNDTAWQEDEAEYIRTRRVRVGISPDKPTVGLALSGGGIRAATFSLGVLKTLSALRLVGKFDYLSTVSGGGYTGGFYASMFVRDAARQTANDSTVEDDPLGTERGRIALRRLRENGRYLLPRGAGDAVRFATTAVRGWLAIQLVIGISLVAFLLMGKALLASFVATGAPTKLDALLTRPGQPGWMSPSRWLIGHPLGGAIPLSPLWPVAAVLLLVVAAMAWAYWLPRYDTIPRSRVKRLFGPSSFVTLLIALASLAYPPDDFRGAVRLIGVLAAGALIVFIFAELRPGPASHSVGQNQTLGALRNQEDRVRNRITRWTALVCTWAFGFAAFASVDTIGQNIYTFFIEGGRPGVGKTFTIGALFAAAIPLVRRIIAWAQSKGSFGEVMRRFGHAIALIAALVIAIFLASFWSVVAELLAWRAGPIGGGGPMALDTLGWLWKVAAIFLAVSVAIGVSIGFLNLSSFSAFYAGRLRRAYLGASNPGRTDDSLAERDEHGDEIQLEDYYVPHTGAPLHLINVTVNETMGRGSSLVQRDRKGRPLTVSVAGFLVPTDAGDVRRYPLPNHSTAPAQRGELPVSNWIGISGAAMSTGLGQNTSLGLAFLAGLANLRLGVWWAPPGERIPLVSKYRWVQHLLAAEFLGHFAGISGKRWYLSDGGHFENTGIYELVRRRVSLIVACDNGADPDYNFADVVNLTRKLRIDFNADLDFLPASKLDQLLGASTPNRAIFGELSQLVRMARDRSSRGPYAAIARIRIPEEGYVATLVLLKPRLSGLEMIDLLDYNRINADFPQQTTGDQFFDEAQWESYFRLGATVAELTFAEQPVRQPGVSNSNPRAKQFGPNPPIWDPATMLPINTAVFPWFGDPWLGEPAATRTQSPAPTTAGPMSGDAAETMRVEPKLAAAGGVQEAATAAVSRIGSGKLIAGAAAALGSLGLATGVGQSIGNAALPRTEVVIPGPSPTAVVLDSKRQRTEERLSTARSEPGTARPDPAIMTALSNAVSQLAAAIDRLPSRSGTGATDRLAAEVRSLRGALAESLRRHGSVTLTPILDKLQSLGEQAAARDTKRDEQLERALKQLATIAASVRETPPRQNVRGSR